MEDKFSFDIEKIHIKKEDGRAIIISVITFIILITLVGVLLWFNRGSVLAYLSRGYIANSQGTLDSQIQGQTPFTEEAYITSAVKKTNPAVVSIIITKDVPKYETYFENPFGDNNPFGQFFQVPQYRQNGTEKQEVGGGSGFLVSKNGLIVTNRHVVEDTSAEYTVYTNDEKKHTATVIARDQVLDIAILQIDGNNYPYLEFGDSDSLVLGQSVIAIGNALGEFRNTVSVGVISGLSRSIVAGDATGQSEALEHVIQTDAAINPGNSGGPLLNLSGKVVGVNVAVAQGSQNIGFALPINSIESVVESVKATGKIIRPYVGIRYTQITKEMQDANNLSVDYGILVTPGGSTNELAVIPGSPADKAGILENDIILELDGEKLTQDTNFALLIREKKIGDTVTLKVLSKGKEKIVSLTLEAAPE